MSVDRHIAKHTCVVISFCDLTLHSLVHCVSKVSGLQRCFQTVLVGTSPPSPPPPPPPPPPVPILRPATSTSSTKSHPSSPLSSNSSQPNTIPRATSRMADDQNDSRMPLYTDEAFHEGIRFNAKVTHFSLLTQLNQACNKQDLFKKKTF